MKNYKGFLITGKPIVFNNFVYDGIECNPWPLDDGLLSKLLTSEQLYLIHSQIDNINIQNEHGLLNLETAKIYANACKRGRQEYSAKFIEAVQNDILNPSDSIFNTFFSDSYCFFGYDVGTCTDDYFSSVATDLIWRPSLFGPKILNKLNSKGLFDNYDDASDFLKKRDLAMMQDKDLNLEKCKVDIMKIYKIYL